MVLALPFLQAVLKMFFLPNAPLLNFLRALAYGFALAGAVVVAFFIGWLCSDESHAFSVKVPALCTDSQLKPAVRSHPTGAARLRVTPLRSLPAGSSLSRSSDCARNVLLRSQSSNCLGAILSWAAPALAGGWSIMLAGISFFISRSHEESGLAAASKLLPVAVRVNACCHPAAAVVVSALTCQTRATLSAAVISALQLGGSADRRGADAPCRRVTSFRRRWPHFHRHHFMRCAWLGALYCAPRIAQHAGFHKWWCVRLFESTRSRTSAYSCSHA